MGARPAVATWALVGLGVLTLGLAGLALTSQGTAPATADAPMTPTAPTTPTAQPEQTSQPDRPSADTSPTPSGSPDRAGTTELPLSVASATIAWRARGGECDAGEASNVERTTDGGATWEPVADTGLVVTALDSRGRERAVAVGLNESCERRVVVTADGGRTWQAGEADLSWSAEAGVVHAPGGATARPCPSKAVVAVEGTSADTAYVLCGNGDLRLTTDGGDTFVTQSTRSGALGLAADVDGVVYVLVADAPDCPGGLQVDASGDEGATWNAVRCLVEAVDRATVGIDAARGSAMVIAGDVVLRSSDGGATWTPPAS